MEKHSTLCSTIPLTNSLWDFALQVYSTEEVEQQSLQLQDEYHANINIILWCCWLEAEGIQLSVNLLDEVLITIDAVSLQTVAKLRDVRRVLLESGAFTKVQAQSVKKHILNAELMIEKVLLHRLQDLTCRFVESKEYKDLSAGDDVLSLEYYLNFISVPDARKNAGLMKNSCRRYTLQSAG
ncbi:MAG: TIGR02444 family protein [Agarilytica sp.]